ncbi:HMG (High mobility group) box domain-containing protein [Spironucleus salmonicida]|uniref:HMG (High mobility group) box domain-containing protein n=1 Tax=Spironucleus salmonicida TaxID=348837 RepID=V6LBG6_9EUKA|nr:HMG (High mobility group) box domain-containing protein [Spironucleus salmonicida]|eukprot:EST41800.1 HMG (high mobility group) box domain-containing protein [Spironucleus salmonicida]
MQRPQKPSTSYFLFQAEIRSQYSHLSIGEQAKAMSQRWKDLTEEQRQDYSKKATEQREQYNTDLIKFYEQNPEAKAAEEAEKAEKKQSKKEPKNLKLDEKNLKLFYFVAFIKRFRRQFAPDYLPASAKVRKILDEKFEADCDKTSWGDKWNKASVADRQGVLSFYKEWLKIKK